MRWTAQIYRKTAGALSFSLSGTVITQSGIDTSWAGIAGNGATANVFGPWTVYDCGANSLRVTGTVSSNATDGGSRETLAIGVAGGTQDRVDIDVDGGTLILGRRSVQGTTEYSSSRFHPDIVEKAALSFADGNAKSILTTGTSQGFLYVRNGGRLEWYGNIQSSGGIGFDGASNGGAANSSVLIRDGVWDARLVDERGGVGDQFIYSYTPDLDVDGFTVLSNDAPGLGSALIILAQTVVPIKGYVPVMTELALTGSTSAPNDLVLTFEDYEGVVGEGATDMTSATNNASNTSLIIFKNSESGSSLVFNTQDPGVSRIHSTQSVRGTILDPNRAPRADAVMATIDVNGVVTQSQASGGAFDLGDILNTEWTPPGGTTPPAPEYFSPSDTDDDLWSYYTYSYLGIPRSRANVLNRGKGGLDLEFISADDPGVTETSRAAADGYTSIVNFEQLYDRSKSHKIDNVAAAGINTPLAVVAGTEVDFGALDIIVDGTAPLAFDDSPGAITINPASNSAANLVGATPAVSSGVADSISVAFPAGIADGNLALLFVGHAQSDQNTWQTLNGWSVVSGINGFETGGTPASVPGLTVYRRTLNGDSGSVTVENAGSNTSGIVAQMLVYSNVDPSSPIASVGPASAATGSPNPNGTTTTLDGSTILVVGFSDGGDQTAEPPDGYTEILETATLDGAGTGE